MGGHLVAHLHWATLCTSLLALVQEVEMVEEECVHYASGAPGRRASRGGPNLKGFGHCLDGAGRAASDTALKLSARLLYLHKRTNCTSKERFPHHQHCLNSPPPPIRLSHGPHALALRLVTS